MRYVLLVLLALAASGCAKNKGGEVHRAAGSIETRVSVVQENARRIATSKMSIESAREFASAIVEDCEKIYLDLKRILKAHEATEKELSSYKNDVWVKVALKIKAWFYFLLGMWVVAGIASVALDFAGLGIAGKFIRRVLPLSNPFGWATDLVVRRTQNHPRLLRVGGSG